MLFIGRSVLFSSNGGPKSPAQTSLSIRIRPSIFKEFLVLFCSRGRVGCAQTFDKLGFGDLSNLFPEVFAKVPQLLNSMQQMCIRSSYPLPQGEERHQINLSSFRDGPQRPSPPPLLTPHILHTDKFAGDEYVRIAMFYANIFLGYLDGASVVVNQVDTHWPHAAAYIKSLTASLGDVFLGSHPPSMNLYVTPPGNNQIFPLHNDHQDVMILQISGSKNWRVQYKKTERYKGMKKLGTDEEDIPALKVSLDIPVFFYCC